MACLCFATVMVQAQVQPMVLPLWEAGAPGFEDRKDIPEKAEDYWVKNIHMPSITVFQPERPNGSSVLICPGGGHRELVFDEEGAKTARYLNTLGVTGIVLKYRLFREEGSPYTREHPKQDALRAIRLVRAHATEWGLEEDRIGIMGFSAGGEVVNMVAYGDYPGMEDAMDPVERKKANPNFQIQIYPGPMGIPKQVSRDVIPLFILASNNDKCCSEPVVQLLTAYRKAGASVEAHIYAKGDHAFNMGDRSEYKSISKWPVRLADWLEDNRFFAE